MLILVVREHLAETKATVLNELFSHRFGGLVRGTHEGSAGEKLLLLLNSGLNLKIAKASSPSVLLWEFTTRKSSCDLQYWTCRSLLLYWDIPESAYAIKNKRVGGHRFFLSKLHWFASLFLFQRDFLLRIWNWHCTFLWGTGYSNSATVTFSLFSHICVFITIDAERIWKLCADHQ